MALYGPLPLILAGRLSRDGVGACASGHSVGPPGIRKQLVHWWSGLNVVEVGGGMAGCGIMYGEGAGVAAGWHVGGVVLKDARASLRP